MDIIRNDNFSFLRMFMLLKREWTANRSKLLMQGGILVGILAMIYFFVIQSSYEDDYGVSKLDDTAAYILVFVMAFCANVAAEISASLICNNLASKSGKINSFMSVGTPLEKYAVRFIIYVLAVIILLFLAISILDFIRICYVSIAYPNYDVKSIYTVICMDFPHDASHSIAMFLLAPAAFIFNQAFFTLMSSITPTYTFIKGFAVSLAIGVVANLFFIVVLPLFCWLPLTKLTDTGFCALLIFASVMLLITAAVFHIIAYYKFKETDLR